MDRKISFVEVTKLIPTAGGVRNALTSDLDLGLGLGLVMRCVGEH